MDEERRNPDEESGWGSIFGLPIPVRRLRWHFWIFGAAVTVMTGVNIAARLAAAASLRWHQIPPAITADIIPTVIFCGVFSPIGVEAIAMVIAAYYTREQQRKAREQQRKAREELREAREQQQKAREELREAREQQQKAREELREAREASEQARTEGLGQGLEQGREQGREQSNAAWREWLDRMQAAQAAGEPFDEPPPDVNGA